MRCAARDDLIASIVMRLRFFMLLLVGCVAGRSRQGVGRAFLQSPPDNPAAALGLGPGLASDPDAWGEPDCRSLAPIPVDWGNLTSAAALRSAFTAVATTRYPFGRLAVEASSDEQLLRWSAGNTGVELLDTFTTVVHEGHHLADSRSASPYLRAYIVRPDRVVHAKWIATFPGAALTAVHPRPLPADSYVAAYLLSPTRSDFQGLLDELNAYVHTLAAAYCIRDGRYADGRQVSDRNGVYAMILFIELSLLVARTQYPADYAALRADPGTRAALLAMWRRAALWLERTQGEGVLEVPASQSMPNGIAEYRAWATHPARVAEVWNFLGP